MLIFFKGLFKRVVFRPWKTLTKQYNYIGYRHNNYHSLTNIVMSQNIWKLHVRMSYLERKFYFISCIFMVSVLTFKKRRWSLYVALIIPSVHITMLIHSHHTILVSMYAMFANHLIILPYYKIIMIRDMYGEFSWYNNINLREEESVDAN